MGVLCMTIKRYLLLANLVMTNGCYFVLVCNFLNLLIFFFFFVMTKSKTMLFFPMV